MSVRARNRPGSIARALALSFALLGCVPTLSEPRGEEHLAAMRDATRHHHHGRMDDAAAAWEDAARTAERRVDRDEAEYRRAQALLRMDRDTEALRAFDAIAGRRPISRRTVRARFEAALIRLERGETRAAHEALEWIVLERPGDGPASRALSLLMEAHEPRAARLSFLRDLYEAVGETDLGDDILTFEAQILRDEGDRAGAVRAYERLLIDHPYPHGQRWDDTLHRLADMAIEDEEYERAIGYLERMIAHHVETVTPGSQTLPGYPLARLRIARIYRDHLDDPEQAAAHFRGMHDQFPTSRLRDDALYELGAMWLDRGQPARGCPVLHEVTEAFEVGHARRLAAERFEVACPH